MWFFNIFFIQTYKILNSPIWFSVGVIKKYQTVACNWYNWFVLKKIKKIYCKDSSILCVNFKVVHLLVFPLPYILYVLIQSFILSKRHKSINQPYNNKSLKDKILSKIETFNVYFVLCVEFHKRHKCIVFIKNRFIETIYVI